MKKKNLLLTAVATLGFTIATWAQVPNYVPSNGLVGWWPFNGNANDESGNGYNGTVNGATLTTDRLGSTDKAYHLPNGSYIYIGTETLVTTSEISFSCWFNTTDNVGYMISTGNQNPYAALISYDNNGTAQIEFNDVDGGVTPLANDLTNDGNWHLLVGVYNNVSAKLYLDGFMVDSIPYSVGNLNTSQGNNNLVFGGYFLNNIFYDFPNFNYEGSLDDIGIWNRALTQDEITALYTSCNLNTNITPNPSNVAIRANASLIASSLDPNANFQWQTDPNNVGWQNVPSNATYNGAKTNNLGVTNVQLGNHNQAFRVIATAGNCIDTSEVALINVLDTCITNVLDTTFITINDTITTQVYDTTFVTETIYDTITTQVFDTITTQVFDTTYVTQTIYDTLYVTETIYDTTYVTVNDTNYTYISVTDTLVINTTLGLTPNQQQNTIKVFPNPASTQITIDYGNFGLMNGYLVKITNNLGQIVYSANITQQSVTLNLGDWTGDGLYHLELFDSQNNVIENRKIVLQ
jgi:hypothetical protein